MQLQKKKKKNLNEKRNNNNNNTKHEKIPKFCSTHSFFSFIFNLFFFFAVACIYKPSTNKQTNSVVTGGLATGSCLKSQKHHRWEERKKEGGEKKINNMLFKIHKEEKNKQGSTK